MRVLRPLAGLAAIAAGPLLVIAGLHWGFDPVAAQAERPLTHRQDGFVGSESCRTCHGDHWASWQRTFHRTMTQWPSEATVQGRFDGRSFNYQGQTARAFRRGDAFAFDLPTAAGSRRIAEVALATGSRRYQQYFEWVEDASGSSFVRLPLLWSMAENEFMHLNTVFLAPDDPNWDLHRATWNQNCLFCHTTAPRPGLVDFTATRRGQPNRFQTEVAELGIACETCHGPGEQHAARQRSPLARLRDGGDRAIVDPAALEPEASISLCGQCHGQRLPKPLEKIRDYLETGPTFRPGARLEDHVFPIHRDTEEPWSGRDEFDLRFWSDGTPRLTAYEYQGVRASACFVKGGMTCLDCHAMHGGDPRGMIEPAARGNGPCLGCHRAIARDVAAHTHHRAESTGSLCYDCHMPRIVYGVLDIHRSHRIENPDPIGDAEHARPNACTLCHLDRTTTWAAAATARWWGRGTAGPFRRGDRAPSDLPEALATLAAGDAVARATVAAAAGRSSMAVPPRSRAVLIAHLAIALGDGYPAVRQQAWRSLMALARERGMDLGIADLAIGADGESRRRAVFAVLDALRRDGPDRFDRPADPLLSSSFDFDVSAVAALTELQSSHVIAIGE